MNQLAWHYRTDQALSTHGRPAQGSENEQRISAKRNSEFGSRKRKRRHAAEKLVVRKTKTKNEWPPKVNCFVFGCGADSNQDNTDQENTDQENTDQEKY